ncbi:unnamed protein product, partial [marine sediment metagenome]
MDPQVSTGIADEVCKETKMHIGEIEKAALVGDLVT